MRLIFVFDGGTNLDPEKDMHIHGVKIKFDEGWSRYQRLGGLCRRQEGWNDHVHHDPEAKRDPLPPSTIETTGPGESIQTAYIDAYFASIFPGYHGQARREQPWCPGFAIIAGAFISVLNG